MSRLPSQGWGPWRREWYSVCSMHYHYDSSCRACQTGQWHNVYKGFISHCVFKLSPGLWRWWANRSNSAFNKMMRSQSFREGFPNLKPKPAVKWYQFWR